jgi:peptidoglycan LD-endopeptidase CwlK
MPTYPHLDTEFGQKLNGLLSACAEQQVIMRPFFRIRSPLDQAKLWRQSRTREEIKRKIDWLHNQRATFLADCIELVGPQHGPPATDAIPGLSWHQWGEAADCLWVVDGKAEWSSKKQVNGKNGYQVYADQAAALGLDPGGHWQSLKVWPHVQLRRLASPEKLYSLAEIDQTMHERFGG